MEELFKKSLEEIRKNRVKGKCSELKIYYNKYIIYKWDINNKSYIGLTTNLEVRFKNYLANIHKDHYISRAINKYLNSEIIFSILCICDTIEELKEKEKYYISKYNTIENGYNLTSGGEHCIVSEETIEKMKDSAKNKKEVYFFNINSNKIELIFESVRESARNFKCNPCTIFAALRNKTIYNKIYKVSYNKDDEFFNEEIVHKNKNIMKGNRNGTRYIWTLIYDNGEIFKEDSLKKLWAHCPEVKESSFKRIAENKMINKNTNFKIIKELKN